MLVEICRRLRFSPLEEYAYVGFGGVAFVDFRLFHKNLGIRRMISIQDTVDRIAQKRFSENKPFKCIQMKFGRSSVVLGRLELRRRSIVWLDYDDLLASSMCLDMETLARKGVKSGTVIFVSYSLALPVSVNDLGDYLQSISNTFDGVSGKPPGEITSDLLAEVGRKTLSQRLNEALSDADAAQPFNERRRAHQIAYFRYRDGVPMATIGWVISTEDDEPSFKQCQFEKCALVRAGNTPYEIKIPILTPYEVRVLERRLSLIGKTSRAPQWLPQKERKSFESCHRFLPDFAVVES